MRARKKGLRLNRRSPMVVVSELAIWLVTACAASLSLALSCVPAGPAPADDRDLVGLSLVTEGLVSPVAVVSPGDDSGRLFVADQIGLIHVLDGEGERVETPFLDVRDRIVELNPAFDERGLLGLAFHPDYRVNGRFFVFYTAPPSEETPAGFDSQNRVSEFRATDSGADTAEPSSERVILRIDKPQFNHNGGQLAFGPDGYLYIAVGDGGGANDQGTGHEPMIGNGQDRTTLLGKLLRVDVDGAAPYSIPMDNPFVDVADARAEIWALGLRNPWRFSFDMGGNAELFAGDAGQDLFEEVNLVTRGANLGWRIREGTRCFNPEEPGVPPDSCPSTDDRGAVLVDPILEYPHLDASGAPVGVAVVGGFVHRGASLPDLEGAYVFGDFSRGFAEPDGSLFAARRVGGDWVMTELRVSTRASGRVGAFVLGFGQDDDGEMYVLTSGEVGPTGVTGRVWKLTPADADVVDVAMRGGEFVPATVTIRAGGRVRWINAEPGIIPHTSTSGAPGDTDEGDEWDSGTVLPGGSWTRRFDEPGEFIYFCRFHFREGMRDARVIVEP